MERTEGRETEETGRGQRCAGWQADGCAVYWFIRRFSHDVPSSHRTSRGRVRMSIVQRGTLATKGLIDADSAALIVAYTVINVTEGVLKQIIGTNLISPVENWKYGKFRNQYPPNSS